MATIDERRDADTSTLELEVLQELSRARRHPAAVKESVRARLSHIRGKDYFPPDRGGKTAVVMKEGAAAVHDAIAYLDRRSALPAISDIQTQGLVLSAEDHLHDLGTRGAVGHQGANGSSSSTRMSRYGEWRGKCGECLWFGRAGTTARQIIEDLIIDDGVASRGHRLGVYDPAYQVAGVRIGPHKTFGMCCVINFAGDFEDDFEKLAARAASGPPEVGAGPKVQTQWRDLGQCAGCQKTIHGGGVIEALGQKWHRDCFKCQATGCAKSLVGVPYQEHCRKPFCKDCYFESFGVTCHGCGNKIHGGVMKAMGKNWHRECFVCSQCGGALEARFATRGDAPVCASCSGGAGVALHGQGRRSPGRAPSGRASPDLCAGRSPSLSKAGAAALGRARAAAGDRPAGNASRPKAAPRPKKVAIGSAKKAVDTLMMDYADL
mmetsp:Transcript_111782/g.193779  ORF Transcript_111782/g.193779 Transcript_111782/m.193779 type:complete len:435 (-) Transcript_111782:45-1349(-)